MKIFTLLFLFLSSFSSFSQNIMAFIDYQKKLQVFEDGVFRQVEYRPVNSFKVGQNSVAFVENSPEFKFYYNGETTDFDYAADIDYEVTRNLIVFRIQKVLRVVDHGKVIPLTYYLGNYVSGDSIVGFYDDYARGMKAYYKGEVIDVETNLFSPPKKMLASANALLYIDPNDYLKLFYKGRVIDLASIQPRQYAVGADIAAWVDEASGVFKVYYRNSTANLDSVQPTSFKCGDRTVAYVDNSGSFKILRNGLLTTVKSFAPDFYDVKEGVVMYVYNGIYYVFYNGQPFELERTIVDQYQISNGNMVYLDDMGHLKMFSNGRVETISVERPVKFLLSGNVVWYKLGVNDDKIYYKGKTY